MTAPGRDWLPGVRRLVVKIGSGVLSDGDGVREEAFGQIGHQVAAAVAEGREVVLVSSGAIALGARALGWDHPGRSIPEKQAAAAVGQIDLSDVWRRTFAGHGKTTGQVLVTRSGLDDRERFLNARHTLTTLLEHGVIPIVNENDTVATDEIRFGDNDNLSATVVNLVGAELLVILTDVDGLYREAPLPEGPPPERIALVEEIDAKIEAAAGGSGNAFGRGGMITKLEAAKSAARSGAATVLCNGRDDRTLTRALGGDDVGTLFTAGSRLGSRKHWLAFTASPRGRLRVDEGAAKALRERGRSLLAVGVVDVDGAFGIGDAVSCIDPSGVEFARGLAAYASADLTRIKGLPTQQIAQVLGYSNGDAVVHRDDLVLLEPSTVASSR